MSPIKIQAKGECFEKFKYIAVDSVAFVRRGAAAGVVRTVLEVPGCLICGLDDVQERGEGARTPLLQRDL